MDKLEFMEVYYVPFHIQTYVPITVINIASETSGHFYLNSKNRLFTLLSKLTSPAGLSREFDAKQVRMKIIFHNNLAFPIYVDRSGTAFRDDRFVGYLNETNKKIITDAFKYIEGAMDYRYFGPIQVK